MKTLNCFHLGALLLLSICFSCFGASDLGERDKSGLTLEQFIIETVGKHISMKGSEASFMLEIASHKRRFEMKGFSIQPYPQSLTEADRLNGVDLNMSLHFRSKVYRSRFAGAKWEDWKNGLPPVLMIYFNIRIERRDGYFKSIESSMSGCIKRKWVTHFQVKPLGF